MVSATPAVVLGCHSIGSPSDPIAKYDTPDKAQSFLTTYRKHGLNQLDTARGYSPGAPHSSEVLMASLSPP